MRRAAGNLHYVVVLEIVKAGGLSRQASLANNVSQPQHYGLIGRRVTEWDVKQ
jgi:hypothetical protein